MDSNGNLMVIIPVKYAARKLQWNNNKYKYRFDS